MGTRLGKPNGIMLYGFMKNASELGIDPDEIAEVIQRWMDGDLEINISEDDLKKRMTEAQNSITPIDRGSVECAACLAACCTWLGCNPWCTIVCQATVCK